MEEVELSNLQVVILGLIYGVFLIFIFVDYELRIIDTILIIFVFIIYMNFAIKLLRKIKQWKFN